MYNMDAGRQKEVLEEAFRAWVRETGGAPSQPWYGTFVYKWLIKNGYVHPTAYPEEEEGDFWDEYEDWYSYLDRLYGDYRAMPEKALAGEFPEARIWDSWKGKVLLAACVLFCYWIFFK